MRSCHKSRIRRQRSPERDDKSKWCGDLYLKRCRRHRKSLGAFAPRLYKFIFNFYKLTGTLVKRVYVHGYMLD